MAKKQTSPEVSSLASRLLREPHRATEDEIKTLAASLISQDETPGQRKITEDDARAMFPNEKLEIANLGHGQRSISATWGQGDEQMRQSMMIPKGEHGLGTAADLLRQAVDAMKAG